MSLNGMPCKGKRADRRGRLSLHCGALLHRTNNSFTCQPVHSSTHTNHTLEVKQDLWGGHPLLWRGLGRLLFAVFWRTDEGVCPYKLVLSLIKGTPFSNQGGRFLAMKRASLHIEETPSLFVNSSIYSPSPFGEGTGERLYLTGSR